MIAVTILKNGGSLEGGIFKINKQVPITAPFEESFTDYDLNQKIPINKKITSNDKQVFKIDFEGIGVVLKGVSRNIDKEIDNKYGKVLKFKDKLICFILKK